MFDGKKVLHYRITTKENKHYVRSGEKFDTVADLVEHLKADSTGIAVALEHTVPKAGAKAVVISRFNTRRKAELFMQCRLTTPGN